MTMSSADRLAHRLSGRIDELARALASAGAADADRTRLLESAALAAMHAVSLEALATAPPERVGCVEAPPATPLRLTRAA